MTLFKADLHIHTVLSPCADLSMSPVNIVRKAVQENIDIIAITDHNACGNAFVTKRLGENHGLLVIPGFEVTTQEEVHCLSLFENMKSALLFQEYLHASLPKIQNEKNIFGEQFIVDEEENILEEMDQLLHVAANHSINAIAEYVHQLKGIFIPAHVNRPGNGLIPQLGFFPADLQCDGVEINHIKESEDPTLPKPFLMNSDAHFIDDIGTKNMFFEMKELTYSEILKTLNGEGKRRILIQ